MRNVSWAALLAAAPLCLLGSAGCTNLSRGSFIDAPPPTLRAGILELRWRRRIADVFALDWHPTYRGSPTYDAARGLIYGGSVDHGLYAVRAGDGAIAWRFETLGRVESTPTLAGDLVIFGSEDGGLYAVEAATGRLRWRIGTPAEVEHAPLVANDTVYFVNANDSVFAVGLADGVQRWRYHRNPPGGITLSGHAGLARSGGRLYTGFSDGTIACLDASDGSVVWEQDTSNDLENIEERNEGHEAIDVDTTPIVLGDTVYAASFTAGLYALDAVGGNRRWRLENVLQVASLGTDDHFLYAASAQSGLIKLDPFDGSVMWARDIGSRAILGAMPVGHGLLAVPTGDRALWLMRTRDGEVLDGVAPGPGFGGLPAFGAGQLFATSNGGVMYALRLTAVGPDDPR